MDFCQCVTPMLKKSHKIAEKSVIFLELFYKSSVMLLIFSVDLTYKQKTF